LASKLAVYLPTLAGGGAEKTMLALAGAFAGRGYRVELLLNRLRGENAEQVPNAVRLVELERHAKFKGRYRALRADPRHWRVLARPVLLPRRPVMTLRYLPGLAAYLRAEPPDILLSALFYANLMAIWARQVAGVSTRLIVTQHNTLSQRIAGGLVKPGERWRWRYLPALIGKVYPYADRIVSVSHGVADDLAATAGLHRQSIDTIYNPVVSDDFDRDVSEPLEHAWFAPDSAPVIVAAGRLTAAKGFDVLLRAFARLRSQRPARLLLLGDGAERRALGAQITDLGLEQDAELCGFVANPYPYMARADLFVLSSRYEGLGNVLIEALACGCPVVSTDCPSGPREILDGGRFGALVPVGDAEALATTMAETLDHPSDRELLRARGRMFNLEQTAQEYASILQL
jgi:glycosyltransferase involved in cell wall biosynthesis